MPGGRRGWAGRSTRSTSPCFCLIMVPIAEEIRRPDDRGRHRLHDDVVDAACRSGRLGLARRPDRAQDAADDLDPLVLDLQLHRRLFADLLVPVGLPRAARHRHGRGMAGRRGARDGATWPHPLARLHERRAAGLVEYRVPAVERDLRPVLRHHRLARHAVGRRAAGAVDRLRPLFRQGARGLGREPAPAAGAEPRGPRAANQHLPARDARQHAVGVLVDGEQLRPLLLDLVAVRDASAAGSEADGDGDGGPVHDRQHPELFAACRCGAGRPTSSVGAGR